eukprot:Platyproteum_vivax@DN5685_c0_g1_i1.p1
MNQTKTDLFQSPLSPIVTTYPDVSGALNLFKLRIETQYASTRDAFRKLQGTFNGSIPRDDWQRVCYVTLGENCEDNIIDELFETFDANEDGVISWDEFNNLISNPGDGLFLRKRKIVDLTPQCISADEVYKQIFTKIYQHHGSVKQAYLAIDHLENRISRDVLAEFLANVGFLMTSEDEAKIIDIFDAKKTGYVDLEHFKKAVANNPEGVVI